METRSKHQKKQTQEKRKQGNLSTFSPQPPTNKRFELSTSKDGKVVFSLFNFKKTQQSFSMQYKLG